jgi:hypothetical protein
MKKKKDNTTAKKKKETDAAHVHPDLTGFDIHINSFGEIVSNYSIDQLNTFLNKNVVDKKLKDREDVPPQEE